MKRIAYMSAILALLVFSGCSTKEPTIDATANGSASSGSANQTSGANATGVDTAVIAPVTNANSADTNANANNGTVDSVKGITSILFDYDKFDIRADMQENIKTNSVLVKNKTFKLEGNCDEFGSDEYNFALGLKRANAVKAALVNEGISADSISMTSLGEGNPVCLEKTQECWAKNRRVDLKLP
ncbi:MAG: OmpA family protein [Campylobacterales bacterium]|nr:OmpA family protein [Campylobacterales bacterium]